MDRKRRFRASDVHGRRGCCFGCFFCSSCRRKKRVGREVHTGLRLKGKRLQQGPSLSQRQAWVLYRQPQPGWIPQAAPSRLPLVDVQVRPWAEGLTAHALPLPLQPRTRHHRHRARETQQ